MKRFLLLALALLLFACSGNRGPGPENWVSEMMNSLTLEQKVGQVMVPAIVAKYYQQDNPQFRNWEKLVRDYHVGGVMYFRANPYDIARSLDRLQAQSDIPLLIVADVEWGIAMRVNESTRFLQNMAIGATGSEDYAYQMGEITGKEARAMGIHIGFAPTVDVNNNPDNIIINTRSYGEDPQQVGRLGAAFIRGLQSQGIYATAKHFPGHGDTSTDSHINLPTIDAPADRLRTVELPPFQAAVDAGVKCVMVAHITYSDFPQMEGRPASMDRYFIQDVLRKQMGFEGMVLTDAMQMGGITENYWSGEAAVMALNAGADMVLLSPNFETTYQFVLQAVRDGRVAMTRLNDAVRKVLEAKKAQGLHLQHQPKIDLAKMEATVARPEHRAKAEEIANAGMTLLRDKQNILPLAAERLEKVLVVSVTDEIGAQQYNSQLLSEVQRRVPDAYAVHIDPRSTEDEVRHAIELSDSVDAVITGAFVKWGSHKGSVSLPDTTVKLLQDFFTIEKPMAVVAFGSPYTIRQLPEVPSYLCAYETEPIAIRAATRAVFGEIPLKATLPVSIPGYHQIGDGLKREARKMELRAESNDAISLQEAWMILEKAMADSIFPGAQVAIVHQNQLIADRTFGRQTYDPASPEITPETLYDMASVTKVTTTTMVAMKLWEQRKIFLDIPIKSYLPEFSGGDKDSVTLRHLLTHSSGNHWWVDLWNKANNRQEALDYIYKLPLDFVPGDSMIYSDLGLILAGHILETVTGKTLDKMAAGYVFKSLGLENTMFNPPKSQLGRIAPTEIGGSMNRGLIHGDVHDENAFFLGGVSAHAGLFSTARDMAALGQLLLNGGIYKHQRIYNPQTIDYWTSRQGITRTSTRALGWDTPSEHGSLAGDYFSKGSFGHTGFTGTSLWIDPNRKVAVVLLTNRVHPTRERGGIGKVRRDFHNAVMKAIMASMGETLPIEAVEKGENQ